MDPNSGVSVISLVMSWTTIKIILEKVWGGFKFSFIALKGSYLISVLETRVSNDGRQN